MIFTQEQFLRLIKPSKRRKHRTEELARTELLYRASQKNVYIHQEKKNLHKHCNTKCIQTSQYRRRQVTVGLCNYKRCSEWWPSASRHLCVRPTTAWVSLILQHLFGVTFVRPPVWKTLYNRVQCYWNLIKLQNRSLYV